MVTIDSLKREITYYETILTKLNNTDASIKSFIEYTKRKGNLTLSPDVQAIYNPLLKHSSKLFQLKESISSNIVTLINYIKQIIEHVPEVERGKLATVVPIQKESAMQYITRISIDITSYGNIFGEEFKLMKSLKNTISLTQAYYDEYENLKKEFNKKFISVNLKKDMINYFSQLINQNKQTSQKSVIELALYFEVLKISVEVFYSKVNPVDENQIEILKNSLLGLLNNINRAKEGGDIEDILQEILSRMVSRKFKDFDEMLLFFDKNGEKVKLEGTFDVEFEKLAKDFSSLNGEKFLFIANSLPEIKEIIKKNLDSNQSNFCLDYLRQFMNTCSQVLVKAQSIENIFKQVNSRSNSLSTMFERNIDQFRGFTSSDTAKKKAQSDAMQFLAYFLDISKLQ